MRFVKITIDLKRNDQSYILPALLAVESVATVFSYANGKQSSVSLVNGDRIIVDMPFDKLRDVLLEHS